MEPLRESRVCRDCKYSLIMRRRSQVGWLLEISTERAGIRILSQLYTEFEERPMRLLTILRYLWTNDDGFFGIGEGPSSAEKSQYGAIGSTANFATSEGMADIGASDKFWRAI